MLVILLLRREGYEITLFLKSFSTFYLEMNKVFRCSRTSESIEAMSCVKLNI